MNYTIITYTEDNGHFDRCGDWLPNSGDFNTEFFREDSRADFLSAWAVAMFRGTYDSIIILLDGVPDSEMTDEEDKAYYKLQAEMQILLNAKLAKKAEAVRKAKEADEIETKRIAELAAQLAHERDLRQFENLKRKLGK